MEKDGLKRGERMGKNRVMKTYMYKLPMVTMIMYILNVSINVY